MASMDVVSTVVVSAIATLGGAASMVADAVSAVAMVSGAAGLTAAASEAVIVAFMAVAGSTAVRAVGSTEAEGSMVVEADSRVAADLTVGVVDFTAAVAATEGDTGKTSKFHV